MSVAEAGACGAALYITQWGGYSSFNVSANCHMVKTLLTRQGPIFDLKMAEEKLIEVLNGDVRATQEQSEEVFESISTECRRQKIKRST